jgi:hypothetical protein
VAITYQNSDEKKIVRQPLSKRVRLFYRSPRKSDKENLFHQKIYMDIHRIYIELELINTKIFNKIRYIIGAEVSEDHVVDTQEGSSYHGARYYNLSKDSVSFFNAKAGLTPSLDDEKNNLYTTSSMAAKLTNLYFKINQLERRVR